MTDEMEFDLPDDEDDDDVPEWLAKLQTGNLYDEEVSPRADDEDALPDWLDTPGASADDEEPEDEDVPAWLSGIRETEGDSAAYDEEDASSDDWLDALSAESEAAAPETDDADPGDFIERIQELKADDADLFADDEGDENLDWLSNLGSEDAAETSAFSQSFADEASADDEDQLPDWLSGLEPPAALADDGGVSDVDDWLAATDTGSLGEAADKQPAAAFADDDGFSLGEEDLPSWLNEIAPGGGYYETIDDAEASAPTYTPAFDEEQPDTPTSDGGPLTPAELPSWLQAMRPVGAVTPAEIITGGKVVGEEERIGPLAGLRGVLPAEPGVVQFGENVKSRTNRLRILEREEQHAALLHDMVANEDRPTELKQDNLPASQIIVRLSIGLAVYALVFIGMLLGFNRSSYPDVQINNAATNQVRQIHNLVNGGLPAGAPILVAFEYEPGLSAELAGAATPLIDNLIISGHPLVLISTSPTGPVVAENFLQANLSKHSYVTDRGYRNLGFLPGEQAGLVSFASSPPQALPLFYSDGSSFWTYAPLSEIRSIRDFGAVIVLSENAEKAQAWVEQVQPQMVDPNDPTANTPLILVVSAQAEALMRPYTQTNPPQVFGIIAGLKGGAYYDSQLPVTNVVREYWDGYGVGITVGFAVILLSSAAGFASGLMQWQSNRRNRGEGAGA